MLYSYHNSFRFDKTEQTLLDTFAKGYNYVYHTAYRHVCNDNHHKFKNNLIQLKLTHLSETQLIAQYLNKPFHLPELNFELSSLSKKFLLQDKRTTGRQLNSINYQLKGNLKSLYELSSANIESKKSKIDSVQEDLIKYKKKLVLQLKLFYYNKNDTKELNKTYFYYKEYLRSGKQKKIINDNKPVNKVSGKITTIINNTINNNTENKVIASKNIKESSKFNFIFQSKNKSKSRNKTKKINYKKFIFDNQQHKLLIPLKHKVITLTRKLNRLKMELNQLILNKINGKLPLCFGTKKLFHKQFHLKHYYKLYDKNINHDVYFNKWKREFTETRNESFYLMGSKDESAGNNSCQGMINTKGTVDLKLRLLDNMLPVNADKKLTLQDRYIILKNLNFGKYHQELVTVLKLNGSVNTNRHTKNSLSQGQAIHYRFERNTDKKSPKYGSWTVTFQVEVKPLPFITDRKNGAVGIDLNQDHCAVTETDGKGNLVKSFNIPLELNFVQPAYTNSNNVNINNKANTKKSNNKIVSNKNISKNSVNNNDNNSSNQTDINKNNPKINFTIKPNYHRNLHRNKIGKLTSHQTEYLLGNIMVKLVNYAKLVGKPIVIENLDFNYKKQLLSNSNTSNNFTKRRNEQLSAFVYAKFAQCIVSRCSKEGVELILVNPAYTSVLGKAKYQKSKGLSVHGAAAYCIARRGLCFKEKIKTIPLNEAIRLESLYEDKVKKYKSNIKINNKISEKKTNDSHNVMIFESDKIKSNISQKNSKAKRNKITISKKESSELGIRSIKEDVYKDYTGQTVVNGKVVNYILPVRNKYTHKYNNAIMKTLSKELKETIRLARIQGVVQRLGSNTELVLTDTAT